MYKILRVFFFVSSIILASSCISHKQFDYTYISSPKDLAGIYVNEETYPPEIIKINYINDKRLEFSTFTDSLWTKPILYKGKFDKKLNTFERWVHRKIYPYIFLWGYDYEKDRIGKSIEGSLVVNNASKNLGIAFCASGGSSNSYITIYTPLKSEILIPSKIDNKWGYKDFLSNKFIIANTYDSVCFFQDSLARVKNGDKWGIINKKNDIIIDLKYDEIKQIENGSMKVLINGKWGIINKKNDIVIALKYDEIKPVENDFMQVLNNGKWGLIDSLGSEILPCIYDEIGQSNKEFRQIIRDSLVGIIDKNYRFVLPCECEKIEQDWKNYNLFIIDKNTLKGLVNISGVICPPIFKQVEILSDNRYPNILATIITLDDKTYYLDSDGYLYPPKKYNFLRDFIIGDFGTPRPPNIESKFHYSQLGND